MNFGKILTRFKLVALDLIKGYGEYGTETTELRDATLLVSNHTSDTTAKPVLDIDHPCFLLESTNGNHHLLIDIDVPIEDYFDLLRALEKCGIISENYLRYSQQHRRTAVRTPWTLKTPVHPESR
jgi:hypothetical protein